MRGGKSARLVLTQIICEKMKPNRIRYTILAINLVAVTPKSKTVGNESIYTLTEDLKKSQTSLRRLRCFPICPIAFRAPNLLIAARFATMSF